MKKIKFAVIGVGAMGSLHLKYLKDCKKAVLAAVCDTNKDRADSAAEEYSVEAFYNHKDLFSSYLVDAVIIATPHYSHTLITIDAFSAGIHVITEKPIAAHIKDAEAMISAHANHSHLKWAVMHQHRTRNLNNKIKEIITDNIIGKIQRISFIFTDWFRTQSYYDSGSWRATWKGEGGGVLLNQSIHHIDLLQWFLGMPVKIKGFCGIGKFHNIEVEDDVTAYLEYENKATAILTVSSGEAPGVERIEIIGDKGKILVEKNELTLIKNKVSSIETIKVSDDGYKVPDVTIEKICIPDDKESLHLQIIKNFTDSIIEDSNIIATGEEGLNSVMIANSILYSSLNNETVELPLCGMKYAKMLERLIENSTFNKIIIKDMDLKNLNQPYA